MRQNADGTWTVVRQITYTFVDKYDLESQILRSRPVGVHAAGGAQGVYKVEDITEAALPVEMPEPMPGMIVEWSTGVYTQRAVIAIVTQHENRKTAIEAPLGREKVWGSDCILRVWSPTHVLLWERAAEPT